MRGAIAVLEAALKPLGFACHRLRFEDDGTAPIENLYARIGTQGPNFCFAGHTDVVPPGDAQAVAARSVRRRDRKRHALWPRRRRHEIGHRRFVAAAARYLATRQALWLDQPCSSPATRKASRSTARQRCCAGSNENGERLDHCLVGEPTCDRACRRHDQDRPPRLDEHARDRARHAGPCRLSAQAANPLAGDGGAGHAAVVAMFSTRATNISIPPRLPSPPSTPAIRRPM